MRHIRICVVPILPEMHACPRMISADRVAALAPAAAGVAILLHLLLHVGDYQAVPQSAQQQQTLVVPQVPGTANMSTFQPVSMHALLNIHACVAEHACIALLNIDSPKLEHACMRW
jgi:hypothetical protein